MIRTNRNRRGASAGFSLIELLVSMAIALVVTIAIASVMIQGEGSRRSTTSVNDVNQAGAYVAYVMDRQIRSAGSGFAQRWGDVFGCAINAARSGTVILPRSAAFGAPFAAASQTPRLAPVIIQADGADTSGAGAQVRGDLITVMAGTAGFSESPLQLAPGTATATSVQLPNSLGLNNGDMLLLADSSVTGGCMVEQINGTPASGVLPLGSSTYYLASGSGVALTNFGVGSTYAIQLGNALSTPAENPPQFQMFGVGDNSTLYSYDLLKTSNSDSALPIADSVVEMRAVYGTDTWPPSGSLTWHRPDSTTYSPATLLASPQKLRQIVAIRLGFILRTSLKERDPIPASTGPIKLFTDLGSTVEVTRTPSTAEQYYRFRTVEVTVPLRNVISAPQSP